jgi:hypothetical protein
VAVANHALVPVRGLQIGMLADKVRYLGLNGLGQQDTRPIAQDFGELVDYVSWLNQLDDVIFGHGISLLRWRSGGVKHPHDMPPFRFPTSPTFGDSSAYDEVIRSIKFGAHTWSSLGNHLKVLSAAVAKNPDREVEFRVFDDFLSELRQRGFVD